MGTVGEECDESQLWIELRPEAYPSVEAATHSVLLKEAGELTAIFTASYKTARANLEKRKAEKKKARANAAARA